MVDKIENIYHRSMLDKDIFANFYLVFHKRGHAKGRYALGVPLFSKNCIEKSSLDKLEERRLRAFIVFDGKNYTFLQGKIKNAKHLLYEPKADFQHLFFENLSLEQLFLVERKIKERTLFFEEEYKSTFSKQDVSLKSRRLIKQKMGKALKKKRRKWLKICKSCRSLKKVYKRERLLSPMLDAFIRKVLQEANLCYTNHN